MLQLPNELLVLIASWLERQRDINAMVRTNHHLRDCLSQYLYRRNADDSEGSALPWAVRNELKDTARRALRTGAPSIGESLSLAVRYRQRAIADMLLAADAVHGNFQDGETGATPLLFAARAGDEYFVKLLIDANVANVETSDMAGRTPLLLAASEGHAGVVKMLIDTGRTGFGHSVRNSMLPLDVALMQGGEAGDGVVRVMVNSGRLRVNMRDELGRSALSRAAYWGSKVGVRELLHCEGIEVDAKDEDGERKTPFCWAAKWGHAEIVGMLWATGVVDVNSQDANGRTPLSWAAECGHESIVKMLLSTGEVDIELKDDRVGRTPLLWAALRGNDGIVQLLLQSGADDTGLQDVPPREQTASQPPNAILLASKYQRVTLGRWFR